MFNLILFDLPKRRRNSVRKADLKNLVASTFPHRRFVAYGNLTRNPACLEAKSFMDKGQLVPDEVVASMIGSAARMPILLPGGFLFDGFPRTAAQPAAPPDNLLSEKGSEITLVLALEVGKKELVARLLNRV